MKTISFGAKIADLRKEQGITQTELASIIGVTSSNVSAYEGERKQPSHDTLVKIAQYFKVSMDTLYGYNSGTDNLINMERLSKRHKAMLLDLYEDFYLMDRYKSDKEKAEERIERNKFRTKKDPED